MIMSLSNSEKNMVKSEKDFANSKKSSTFAAAIEKSI